MSKGSILIYTSAAGQAAPLPGVTLTVTDAGGSVRARLVTDADGFAEAADLPAPDAAYSLDAANTAVQPYAIYRIEAALDGWQPLVLNGVQVFDAQQTVARLNLLPAGAAPASAVSRTVEVVPLTSPYVVEGKKRRGFYFDFSRIYRNKPEGYTYKRDRTWQFNNLKPRTYK